MSGFRYPVPVMRMSQGSYDENGEWQEGVPSTGIISATVQPVAGRDMVTLPANRQWTNAIRVYSSERLSTLADNRNPDRVQWQGHWYELVDVQAWQSGVINHYKYYADRIEDTSTAGPTV